MNMSGLAHCTSTLSTSQSFLLMRASWWSRTGLYFYTCIELFHCVVGVIVWWVWCFGGFGGYGASVSVVLWWVWWFGGYGALVGMVVWWVW